MPQERLLFSWVLGFWLSLWLALPLPVPIAFGVSGPSWIAADQKQYSSFFQNSPPKAMAQGVYFPNISISPALEFSHLLHYPFILKAHVFGASLSPQEFARHSSFFKKKVPSLREILQQILKVFLHHKSIWYLTRSMGPDSWAQIKLSVNIFHVIKCSSTTSFLMAMEHVNICMAYNSFNWSLIAGQLS